MALARVRLFALAALLFTAIEDVQSACPGFINGVLAMHNRLRAAHNTTGRVKRLSWSAALAAKAQAHASKCRWGHTDGAGLQGNGESIMSSPPQVVFPLAGMDACTYAAWALYQEVTAYNFDVPGTSKEPDMPIGHLINLLWADTRQLGCGFKRCPGALGSFVVCWYGPGFYMTPSFRSKYKSHVPRSRCQLATGDDWCASCTGRRCTACFARPQYGQEMAPFPITYNAARKRCVSACSPSRMPRCGLCSAKKTCLACKAGWRKDARGKCTVRDGGARTATSALKPRGRGARQG